MSVFTFPEENQSGFQHLHSQNRDECDVGSSESVRPFEGIGHIEPKYDFNLELDSAGETVLEEKGNAVGFPDVLHKFYGQGMTSLDRQLTSQILSSIKNRIASNINHINQTPSPCDGQNYSALGPVKQENPEGNYEFHESVQKVPFYSESSQTGCQKTFGSCSASSVESNSVSHSPDSSLFPAYPPVSFPCTSTANQNPFGTFCSDSNPGVVSPSVPVVDTCDSTQSANSPEGARCKPMLKQTNLLPPCRVCGDKASGFHYGANTCEACKGFFRRSLKKEKLDYKCNGNNSCEIQKGRRNNCPMCRYNRCLNAGMSKQAIKTGRYTHEKRTQDIVEVKTLKGELSPNMLQPSFIKMEYAFKNPVKKTISEENRRLLDQIYTAHKIIFPLWHKVLDTGSHTVMSRKYAEKYEQKKRMKSETIKLAPEEFSNNAKTFSEDEVKRINRIDAVTKHIEIAVMAFVRYAKAVPGFTELCLNDQAALVKLSRFEIWMIGAHKFMDFDLKVVSGPRGNSYHMDELSEVIDEGFVRSLFNFSQSMQDIHLTNEETALLKCVALTFADRSELQEAEKVEAIQQRLTECLEELLGDGQRFAKVMNALIRLRDLTEWNKTISENMILEWPTMKQHPLLLEIMSV